MNYGSEKAVRTYMGTNMKLDMDKVEDYSTIVVDASKGWHGVQFVYEGTRRRLMVDESVKPTKIVEERLQEINASTSAVFEMTTKYTVMTDEPEH